MDDNKWANLSDGTEKLDAEFIQNLLHNYFPIHPEPEPQFYTPVINLSDDIPNEASTSTSLHPELELQSTSNQILNMHLDAYQTNFEKHVQHSWNYISQIGSDEPPRKRRKPFVKISDLAPTKEISNDEIPRPVCSCTGTHRACVQWEKGGWQSICCNTKISKYPLPKDPNNNGRRIRGRKITPIRFRTIFEELKAAGYDLTKAIDLKDHWSSRYK